MWLRFKPTKQSSQMETAPTALEFFAGVMIRLKKVDISKRTWRKHQDFIELDSYIDGARGHAVGLDIQHTSNIDRAEAWLYALALQAPRAAVAQEIMDTHPHGYHNKEKRLFELIDFNDAFDAAILALPHELLPYAVREIRELCDFMCRKAGTRCFSDEQFQALVHGLSREIAVYNGLKKEGFNVEMTTRREDAFGIDMRIIEPQTDKMVNVDIKTRASYHYRVNELKREGRLSEEGLIMADRNGFTAVMNGHGSEQRRVVTWRIDHEVLGDVVNFEFQDTTLLGETMRAIMLRYGERV